MPLPPHRLLLNLIQNGFTTAGVPRLSWKGAAKWVSVCLLCLCFYMYFVFKNTTCLTSGMVNLWKSYCCYVVMLSHITNWRRWWLCLWCWYVAVFTACSELHNFLFLALFVTFLFVCEISRELLNGFLPNSQGRLAWSLAWMSLMVEVNFGGSRVAYVWKNIFALVLSVISHVDVVLLIVFWCRMTAGWWALRSHQKRKEFFQRISLDGCRWLTRTNAAVWFAIQSALFMDLMLVVPCFDQSSVCRLLFISIFAVANDSTVQITHFCCGACFALLSVFPLSLVQLLWHFSAIKILTFTLYRILFYKGWYFAHVWCWMYCYCYIPQICWLCLCQCSLM